MPRQGKNRLSAEIVRPDELDHNLVLLWDRFRSTNPVYLSPFFSPHFSQAVGHARSDARVAVLQQGGDVVGFLPFHLVHGSIGKPIGGHLNDYHGPILAPGVDITPEMLLRAAKLSAYDFNHLPVAIGGLSRQARAFSTSPRIDLSDGYDAFVAQKGEAWARTLPTMRRKWRKTERELGPIRFTFHDPSDAIFHEHMAMKHAGLARIGVSQASATGWEDDVLAAIRRVDEPGFAGVMTTLHAGDRLIAAHFGIRSQYIWHWWLPSYDASVSNLSPGVSLLDQCAQAANANGLTAIDLGRGNERYKQSFANSSIDLCEGSFALSGSLADGLRQVSYGLAAIAERLPLGPVSSVTRRALARFVFGTALPRCKSSNNTA